VWLLILMGALCIQSPTARHLVRGWLACMIDSAEIRACDDLVMFEGCLLGGILA
jgi:hypothetical protein